MTNLGFLYDVCSVLILRQIYDNAIFWKSHDNLMIVEITKYISGNVKNIDNDRYVILCN